MNFEKYYKIQQRLSAIEDQNCCLCYFLGWAVFRKPNEVSTLIRLSYSTNAVLQNVQKELNRTYHTCINYNKTQMFPMNKSFTCSVLHPVGLIPEHRATTAFFLLNTLKVTKPGSNWSNIVFFFKWKGRWDY